MRLINPVIFIFLLQGIICAQPELSSKEINDQVVFSFEKTNDLILLKVRFQNVLPLKFIFDTGAEHCILFKKEYSDLLGITYQKKIPLLGSDLSQEIFAFIARGVILNIEDACLAKTDMLVLEDDYIRLDEYTGTNIDGILGANIFRSFVVFVNNRHNKIAFIRPNKFNPGNRYQVIPIQIYKNKPFINAIAMIDREEIPIKLLMDTGAALPLLLYTNTHEDLKLPPETINGNIGMGLGGLLEGYIGRLNKLSFADYEFVNLITSYQELNLDSIPKIEIDRNGLLGNTILSRFNYYIDYINEKLYIKPNKKYRKKFRFDKSGLLVAATGPNLKNYIIQKVITNSPASELGLKQGDVIKKINGLPSQLISLPFISAILAGKEGKKIRLIILRNGEKMKLHFKLRNLI